MKQKIFSFILAVALLSFSLSLVWAQEAEKTDTNVASPTTWQEKIKQKIETRKENLEQHQEQVKVQLSERTRNRVQTATQNMMRRLERRIERLGDHALRLQELTDRFETRGADVADTRVKISEAEAYLDMASTDLDNIEANLDQVLQSQDPRSDFEDLRIASQTARDDLHASRKALVEAVSLLKVQKGQLEGGENVE